VNDCRTPDEQPDDGMDEIDESTPGMDDIDREIYLDFNGG
jgi:hypothetical protein